MLKLINGAYFLLSAIGFYLAMQLLWTWRTRRTFSVGPILVFLSLLGIFYLIGLWSDFTSFPTIAAERTAKARVLAGPIRVAGVWPKDEPVFFEAARQAVAEINAAGGVQLLDQNRELVPHKVELVEFPSAAQGDTIYRSVAHDTSLVAVVGHRDTDDAIQASITYSEAGLLYVVPTVTIPALTSHNFQRLIRVVPDDSLLATRMAQFLQEKELKRIAILQARTSQGETLARYMARALLEQTMHENSPAMPAVSLIRSYPPDIRNFDELITEIVENNPDAVVIADVGERAADLIRRIRERGIDLPLVGMPNLEGRHFFQSTGKFSDNVYIVSLLDEAKVNPPDNQSGLWSRFTAGQAYEAIHLLAKAWSKAGSADPGITAATLRAIPTWDGQYGVYDFRPNGDMQGRTLHMKRSVNGQFLPLGEAGPTQRRSTER